MSADFYVVRTPWTSLIVHRVPDPKVLLGDYEIIAGPFETMDEAYKVRGEKLCVPPNEETKDASS